MAGETLQLTATVSPTNASNKVLMWSSGNLGVANVNQSGQTIASSVGTATITATAQDGSGKVGTCAVTVS